MQKKRVEERATLPQDETQLNTEKYTWKKMDTVQPQLVIAIPGRRAETRNHCWPLSFT